MYLYLILAITVAKTTGIKVGNGEKYIVFTNNMTYIAERVE